MRSAEKDTPHTRYFSPDEIAEMAESRAEDGNIGVAYTYNEPFISYEYMLDCVKLVKAKGMKNVVVTNGYVNAEPLGEILPYIDAMNIDLKGFSDDYYKMLKGGLLSVLDTITNASKSCHAELTTLIIPGENDRGSEMEAEAKWIAALNPDIPLHITRFFPRYDMKDKQPTPPETIHRLRAVAEKYLNYVYEGNMW